jgi:hypothetical protein
MDRTSLEKRLQDLSVDPKSKDGRKQKRLFEIRYRGRPLKLSSGKDKWGRVGDAKSALYYEFAGYGHTRLQVKQLREELLSLVSIVEVGRPFIN